MFSRMPVPVWDSDMVYLEEPVDTATTVVSDDIWKKFDLDVPLENYQHRYQNQLHDDVGQSLPAHHEVPMMMHFDKLNCQASREIRHHDCMWAGLCISKEHNRTHPAKKDNPVHRRIPAGRSLLIPKNLQQQQQHCSGSSQHQPLLQQQQHQQQHSLTSSNVHSHSTSLSSGYHQSSCRTTTKNLESDGDSTRPETPQSSESETESEEEEEDEVPVFRHEQIVIDDIVSMPVSSPGEVTNQSLRSYPDRRKEQLASHETVIRNTLMSDHCYHLNQQPINSKKLEHLGVQTPSDSEEEIDVVSYEKPTRVTTTAIASSLPTYPSPADQQHFQLTVKTAFKERNHGAGNAAAASNATGNGVATPAPTPRPRGRPPTNPASRKRQMENAAIAAAATTTTTTSKAATTKRARHHRPYQRRSSPQKQAKISPHSSPSKNGHASSSRSSSDDEPDTEKRSLHNNMERQRRIELRNAFEDLRVLVPEVEAKEKAPKVAILRQAASYCYRLSDADRMNEAKVSELKRKQDRLRAQLSHLRRSLALQR